MKEKKFDEPQIFNPGGLGGHELSQSFCGTCHTSFEQAMLLPAQSESTTFAFSLTGYSTVAGTTRTIRESDVSPVTIRTRSYRRTPRITTGSVLLVT